MAKNELAELREYIEELGQLGEAARSALKEQIDIEAQQFEQEIKSDPDVHEHVKKSLKLTKIDTVSKYGYKWEFEGESPTHKMYDESGARPAPYEAIAKFYNSGVPGKIPRTLFIVRAIRKFKGLDKRANDRFQDKISKENNG